MSTKFSEGRLRISRPRGSGEPDYMEIQVTDDLSGTRFVTVRVRLAEFTEALTALEVSCQFDLRPDKVGMRYEHKEEFVPCSNFYVTGPRRDEVAAAAFAPFEIDGWKGRTDDLFNQHRRNNNGARVLFTRHVKVPVEE